MVMAAMIAIMATTIINSINVNPLLTFSCAVLLLVVIVKICLHGDGADAARAVFNC